MTKIGIIGGSGLYKLEIENVQELGIETAYGKPSSILKTGKLNGVDVVFLNRHGLDHTVPPTQVNFRANIQALKDVGCTHIIATTACGSLKKEIDRGHLVILDQFIDFTRHRNTTFFDEFKPGEHGHTAMATPFDEELRNSLISSCKELGLEHHETGTVITIEGPRFSTKAESKMFHSWGADVINMSVAPETALAKEAGIPYAAVAMSTDYDCLFDDIPEVTHEEVLKVFSGNVGKVIKLITKTVSKIKPEIDLKSTIRTIPNWPKEGVMFRDITTLLQNPEAFELCIKKFKAKYQSNNIDKIVGIESRGFIFGAALARELHIPLVLIRKKGKLPAETYSEEYELEYGTDCVEIHKSSLVSSDSVLVVDDLIATGGTALAACKLVEKTGASVASCAFVVNLPDLNGASRLEGYKPFWLVEFEGD